MFFSLRDQRLSDILREQATTVSSSRLSSTTDREKLSSASIAMAIKGVLDAFDHNIRTQNMCR